MPNQSKAPASSNSPSTGTGSGNGGPDRKGPNRTIKQPMVCSNSPGKEEGWDPKDMHRLQMAQ